MELRYSCLLDATHETSSTISGATGVTLEHPQILRTPRKVTFEHPQMLRLPWKETCQEKSHYDLWHEPHEVWFTMADDSNMIGTHPAMKLQNWTFFHLGNAFCMEKLIISCSGYLPKLQVDITIMLRLPRKVTPQHRQMLRKSDVSPSPNVAPATKSHSTMCGTNRMKPHLQWRMIRTWFGNELVISHSPVRRGYFSHFGGALILDTEANNTYYEMLPRKATCQHHQMLRRPRKVTLQHHQTLRLPRKVTLQREQMLLRCDVCCIWCDVWCDWCEMWCERCEWCDRGVMCDVSDVEMWCVMRVMWDAMCDVSDVRCDVWCVVMCGVRCDVWCEMWFRDVRCYVMCVMCDVRCKMWCDVRRECCVMWCDVWCER